MLVENFKVIVKVDENKLMQDQCNSKKIDDVISEIIGSIDENLLVKSWFLEDEGIHFDFSAPKEWSNKLYENQMCPQLHLIKEIEDAFKYTYTIMVMQS